MQIQSSSCALFHSISTILFILIIISSTSLCQEDEGLFYCYSHFSCGENFPNISYPFWGGNKNLECGLEEYHLTCQQDDHLDMHVAGQTFRVLSIDDTNRVLRIARSDLWDDVCPENNQNTSIIYEFLFTPGEDFRNISLFYSCPNVDLATRNQFNCTNTSGNVRNGFFPDESTVEDCESSISVPVLQSALEEFRNNTTVTVQELLNQGFNVAYNLDNIATIARLACERSGGEFRNGTNSTLPSCLCGDEPHAFACSADQGNSFNLGRKIIIGFSAAAGTALIMCLIFVVFRYRKKKLNSGSTLISRDFYSYPSSATDPEKSISHCGVHIFEYKELEVATNSFDSAKELGDGGFGTVYKGKLQDGRDVAVKRLYESNFKRLEQFINEVEILTRLRHQNLVSLYGCTSRHCRELLLVYEYIPNGTVADHLHGSLAKPGSLPWSTRMNIAIETASALSYLHASDVIHRDIKTNNILLDNNFCVKVADFGLSRLFPINATHISTAPQGTPGYVDPEYHECYHLTDKSDVFSFGVVLIELISSLPAVDITRHRHDINLSNMAINKIQSRSLHELVDPHLGFKSDYRVEMMITDVAELAFQCLQYGRDMRPTMQDVLQVLLQIQSRDYSAGKSKEMDIRADDVVLLETHQLTSSPDSVIEGWVSSSTTTTASN